MVGVASQIIFCIFAAAVIGSVAGYLICNLRTGERIAQIERSWKEKLGQAPSTQTDVDESASVESLAESDEPRKNGVQFEDKLSQALGLIEQLARSQQRMESEIVALRKGDSGEFKLEPSNPKA